MSTLRLVSLIAIALTFGAIAATFCQSEPLPDVSQYEAATPIYSH